MTVLVGHVLLKRYLPRMLAQRGIAHINVRFASTHELAAMLTPPELATRPRITPAANRLLVRRVAEAADGLYFSRIRARRGFVDALGRLFRELELGGFDHPGASNARGRNTAGRKPPEAARTHHASGEGNQLCQRSGQFLPSLR